jgi:DinB superfamily
VTLASSAKPARVSAPERAICLQSAALNSDDRDRQAIRAGFERARATFHALLEFASEEELARPSNGTRWTNRQLLFHMMFGYIVVRALLPLVRFVSRLPNSVGGAFAAVLDAATTPFDVINYWGSRAGSRLYPRQRMGSKFDGVIAALERRLAAEHEANLDRSMAFPTRWDPFFKDKMTLADVYQYPAQHFDFHERQLTLR